MSWHDHEADDIGALVFPDNTIGRHLPGRWFAGRSSE